MKRLFQILLLLLVVAGTLSAQSPKRDVRAVWLSTAWNLDWPPSGNKVPAATGSNESARETARNAQKTSMDNILNKLQAANFNTVFFQVRPMSDALYKSKYEPWSSYLSSVRGADPGWDPLTYIVEEAHKRGIEVHAWLNPYRYSTAVGWKGTLANDYDRAHPDWIMDYGIYTASNGTRTQPRILNPGMSEVRRRICDIIEDIITNYDVDGIVFDDYFYADAGAHFELDSDLYKANNPKGLSQADWRRENVNQMVRDVQTRINAIKPYLTFGISPAGVAASDPAVAAKYGVDPSPGGDWQYNSIYSEPVAWLYNGSIDYISPQIYWPSTNGGNYKPIAAWWSKVSNKFGRYFFSSTTSSYSSIYGSIYIPDEIVNQVKFNRAEDLNDVTGTVLFRTNSYSQAAYNTLKNDAYQKPALTAAYGWKPAPMQSLVENLSVSGQNLTWEYSDNEVRYSVYAIPNANSNDVGAFMSSKYLSGVAYSKTYTLPAGVNTSTHKIAVAVYDRYGNEFSLRVYGDAPETLEPAQLTYPAADAKDVVLPAMFMWNANSADYYVWELSEDAAFTKPVASRETVKNEFFSLNLQACFKENVNYYWRIKSIRKNAPASMSEVRSFSGVKFNIISPENKSENVSMTPEISWNTIAPEINYTLEISTDSLFNKGKLTYTTTVQTTTVKVPKGNLTTSTTYYARVVALPEIKPIISERIRFVTEEVPVPVPTLVSPADGVTILSDAVELSWQQQDSKSFQAELSQNSAFPPRQTTMKPVGAFVYSYVFSNLKEGTYYLRVRAEDSNGLTEPSEHVTVYLASQAAISDVDASKSCYNYYDAAGNCYIVINDAASSSATIDVYSITGMLLNKQIYRLDTGKNTLPLDMTNYTKGLYLVKVNTGSIVKTIKVRK